MANSVLSVHQNQVIHLDVKLENFLIVGGPEGTGTGPSGGDSQIKIADFGLARRFNPKTGVSATGGDVDDHAGENSSCAPIQEVEDGPLADEEKPLLSHTTKMVGQVEKPKTSDSAPKPEISQNSEESEDLIDQHRLSVLAAQLPSQNCNIFGQGQGNTNQGNHNHS